jgi:hypothetical protein
MDVHSLWRRRMTKVAALLLVILAPTPSPPPGLLVLSPIQKGCAADYAKYCKPQRPDATVQKSCLRQYWTNLSPSCRSAMGGSKNNGGDDSGDDDSQ